MRSQIEATSEKKKVVHLCRSPRVGRGFLCVAGVVNFFRLHCWLSVHATILLMSCSVFSCALSSSFFLRLVLCAFSCFFFIASGPCRIR